MSIAATTAPFGTRQPQPFRASSHPSGPASDRGRDGLTQTRAPAQPPVASTCSGPDPGPDPEAPPRSCTCCHGGGGCTFPGHLAPWRHPVISGALLTVRLSPVSQGTPAHCPRQEPPSHTRRFVWRWSFSPPDILQAKPILSSHPFFTCSQRSNNQHRAVFFVPAFLHRPHPSRPPGILLSQVSSTQIHPHLGTLLVSDVVSPPVSSPSNQNFHCPPLPSPSYALPRPLYLPPLPDSRLSHFFVS